MSIDDQVLMYFAFINYELYTLVSMHQLLHRAKFHDKMLKNKVDEIYQAKAR